jgi:Glycosyltransferase family 87
MALTRQWYAKLAFAVLIVWCADIYYKINILRPISGLPNASDFAVYYHAGRDILSGISPYENAAYFYPPLVAFLMAPFALTDYVSARCIWFALSNGFLLLSAWLLWRAIGRDRVALGCIAIVWAFGGAAKETLDIGQLSPVLVLALVIAYSSRGELRGVVDPVASPVARAIGLSRGGPDGSRFPLDYSGTGVLGCACSY